LSQSPYLALIISSDVVIRNSRDSSTSLGMTKAE
jgi:hypothetical protein